MGSSESERRVQGVDCRRIRSHPVSRRLDSIFDLLLVGAVSIWHKHSILLVDHIGRESLLFCDKRNCTLYLGHGEDGATTGCYGKLLRCRDEYDRWRLLAAQSGTQVDATCSLVRAAKLGHAGISNDRGWCDRHARSGVADRGLVHLRRRVLPGRNSAASLQLGNRS